MSHFSRRNVLSMMSSLPMMASLKSLSASAQNMAVPKRVVLFFTPHGTLFDRWRPTVANGDFTLQNILAPLQPFKNKISVIDGLGLNSVGPGAPHTRGPAALFTGAPLSNDGTFPRSDCSGGCNFGWNTGISVDQEIANRLGAVTPYKSIEFGVSSGGGFPGAHISYAGPAKPMIPRQDARQAYADLFSSRLQSEADRTRKLKRRLSILSGVNQDLTRVKSSVAHADWQKLSAQADSLSEIERGLNFAVSQCTIPTAPAMKPVSDSDYKAWQLGRQTELLAASLACGLTRVASLQFRVGENDGGTDGIYSWLGQTQEHHLTSHDGSAAAQTRLEAIYTWYAKSFADLLLKLDSYPEADGTLLDHTMVIWGTELGNAINHSIDNIPFVVAGGGKAGLKMNQYLRLPPGGFNSRLLVSMMHFMGHTDVQTFGSADNGTGPLPGLFA
jgi:Protein of unknown function (DUF1552)